VLRRRAANIPAFMDAAAPGLLVAQAIGRIGNYFNQELFGGPTNLPCLRIDLTHRPTRYAPYATFHPTFLYELISNVTLAAALIWLGRRGRIRSPGIFALYVAGYSGFRIFEELLRVDPAHHILGLRLNFYVAGVLFVLGVTWFIHTQRWWHRARRLSARGGPAALGLAWATCSLIGCGNSHGVVERSQRRGQDHRGAPPSPTAERGTAAASSFGTRSLPRAKTLAESRKLRENCGPSTQAETDQIACK
jgi:hypothetical protein